jgi:SlyX protein
MNKESMEQALESLQIKLAYQEDTIEVLSETMIRQQEKMNKMEHLMNKMLEKLKSVSTEHSPINDKVELPPHY